MLADNERLVQCSTVQYKAERPAKVMGRIWHSPSRRLTAKLQCDVC